MNATIILEIIATVLIADFVSGFFHWLEDAYGREHWLITGSLVTRPNILRHHEPRYFTRHTWLQSSWDLLCVAIAILLAAWFFGLLTWQVWLFAVLGANANQIHKWAHRTPAENGFIISTLQRIRLVQTPRHHACHHTDPKNSHYCVLTDFLNPVLDGIRFWERLEGLIWMMFRVRRRPDTSVALPTPPPIGFQKSGCARKPATQRRQKPGRMMPHARILKAP
jgi:ubiquitin-conjugating enzyme E2 variant